MGSAVRLVTFPLVIVLGAVTAACGSSPPASLPGATLPVTPMPTVAPTAPTAPTVSTAPATPTTPVAAIPLLEPPPSVNAYACVTQLDNGADKDYLWTTVVRDQNSQSLRYDQQRGDTYTTFLMTQIGDEQWEDTGMGYRSTDTETDAEAQARLYEVPTLFSRFFVDTNSLAGFTGSDEIENASNIPAYVFRTGAGSPATTAMAADELIGSISTAAYAVSVDGGALVEARFSGQSKSGADLYLTLSCAQYDDASLIISPP